MKSLIRAIPNQQTTTHSQTLDLWREQALNTILYVALIIGFITLVGSIVNILTTTVVETKQVTLAIIYAAIYILILGIALVKRANLRIRSALFILSFFVYGLLDLLVFGFLSAALLFLFASTVLTALFFSLRFYILILVLNLATMGIVGYMLVNGTITIAIDAQALATDPGEMIAHSLIWLVLNGLLIGAILSLITWLSQSLQYAQDATRQATQAQELAEQHATSLAQQAEILTQTEQRLRDLVATLDTPTIPLTQGMLLAVIVGVVDAERSRNITRRLLFDVQHQRAHTILIDITGVTMADTEVAQALVDTSQALHLMGCEVIITGITSSFAATFTTLDVGAHMFKTARSPQAVLEMRQHKKV